MGLSINSRAGDVSLRTRDVPHMEGAAYSIVQFLFPVFAHCHSELIFEDCAEVRCVFQTAQQRDLTERRRRVSDKFADRFQTHFLDFLQYRTADNVFETHFDGPPRAFQVPGNVRHPNGKAGVDTDKLQRLENNRIVKSLRFRRSATNDVLGHVSACLLLKERES